MNLLSTLNAGVYGAANGWCELYVRGTSIRATWYEDFEGSTSDSSGENIALDAYGAAEIYVNQLVDVVVKDPDGVVVRSYTDGYSSPNIEVVSPSFTGTDYVTAASAVNEPTTLQAIMNLWFANAGAPDWKVSIGGTATTLTNAVGALTGLVYNVKSPVYGAVGNGLTNDQAAIQAALAAAVAAGGGVVFFPKGTYLISTAIEWDSRVAMVGIGAGLSVVTTNSASNGRVFQLTLSPVSNAPLLIHGMAFASTTTNTGTQFYTSSTVDMVFNQCRFNATPTSTGIGMDVAGADSRVVYRDCNFLANGGTHALVGTAGAGAQLTIERCLFKTTGTTFGAGLYRHDAQSVVVDSTFDISSVTGGATEYGIESASTNDLTVRGCTFITDAVTFDACISLLGGLATVSGCSFGSSTKYTSGAAVYLATGSSLQLEGYSRVGSASTALTIPDAVSLFIFQSTGTVPTLTLPKKFYIGQRLVVIVMNDSGADWVTSIVFTGDQPWGTVDLSAVDNEVAFCEFIVADVDSVGVPSWVPISMKLGSA